MSDDSSSEELGGLSATTPVAPAKRAPAARTATKPTSRSVPGPAGASKPASGVATKAAAGGRKRAKISPEPEAHGSTDIEEVIQVDLEEDGDVQEVVPAKPRPQLARRGRPINVNGRGGAKTNGKVKEGPPKTVRKPGSAAAPMDVDPIEVVDMSLEEAVTSMQTMLNDNSPGLVERLRREATEYKERIATLTKQLEESFHVRVTEAEKLMRRQEAQYQAQISAQEALINKLTSQLAQKEPLTGTGKTSVLHLLSREAADEEKRTLEKEMMWWKDVSEEKQREIVQKDERIADLEQIVKELRYEVKVEVDRANSLAKSSRVPSSATRGRPGGVLGADDPKHAEVILFYEDLTNLLITSMKPQMGKYLDMEEWTFTCIYTFTDADENSADEKKSLNFTLRCCFDPMADVQGPITSKDQLVRSMHYVPLELDKEDPEFVEKLGFLNQAFTFGRDQFPLFLRTVYSHMNDALKSDDEDTPDNGEDDNDDDDVQIIA